MLQRITRTRQTFFDIHDVIHIQSCLFAKSGSQQQAFTTKTLLKTL